MKIWYLWETNITMYKFMINFCELNDLSTLLINNVLQKLWQAIMR